MVMTLTDPRQPLSTPCPLRRFCRRHHRLRRVQVLAEKYRMEDKVQTVVLESCLKDLRVGVIYDMNKYSQNIQQF